MRSRCCTSCGVLPPALDMDYEKRVQQAIREIVTSGLVESAHDVSDGGLAVAIAECTFGGVGAKIEVDWDIRSELLLFHEGPSRVVVSTRTGRGSEEDRGGLRGRVTPHRRYNERAIADP